MAAARPAAHQLVVLAAALALVGGLFVLPKGIVKPKEGKAELNSDAAKTANRDGGGPNTNGSKAEASSGPVPASATDNNGPGGMAGGQNSQSENAAPHTSASPAQRSEINTLLAKFAAEPSGAAKATLAGTLAARYRLPQPRLALGVALRGLATAMLDVSDGLVQDAGHLARLAGCAAVIEAAAIPLSPMARAAGTEARAAALSGGDDYELLFAAHPADAPRIEAAARAAHTPVTRIGRFTPAGPDARFTPANPGTPSTPVPEGRTFTTAPAPVMVLDERGRDITPARGGWSHT